MPTDYIDYWGMSKPPFSLTPDPDMFYLSSQHAECLIRLKYAIFSQKGGALLVSDNAGNGKTSALARLKKDLDDYYAGRVRVVFIDHPTLTPIEMIGEIAHQLGAELNTTEKIRALNHLRDRLFSFYNENIKVVVIVDEGQMLKERTDILDELRILLNFCVADAFLLTFIFSGQKPLDSTLKSMPEFWQRLPVRFFLRNLDFPDTKAMIKFRLEQVGITDDIFTNDAYEGIYKYSDGCPRIVCSVADLCLVIGYAKNARRIGFVEVSHACRDMESSGDGFHYYTYVKSQQLSFFDSPETNQPQQPPPRYASSSSKSQSIEKKPQSAVSLVNAVSCPTCAEANHKDRTFCVKCDSPLYRKCPECLALIDTVSNECSECGSNIEEEGHKIIEKTRNNLLPFDIINDSFEVWLKANSITLLEKEQILIILPRGNFVTPGPTIELSIKDKKSPKEPCDIIVTDKRLILGIGRDIISIEHMRIDLFMVSDTRRLFQNRYMLLLGFNGKLNRIYLSYGSRKSKSILDYIAAYVSTVMLK
ncbi:AAA family ATPase [Candidatus Latescibacterota bacterium]